MWNIGVSDMTKISNSFHGHNKYIYQGIVIFALNKVFLIYNFYTIDIS